MTSDTQQPGLRERKKQRTRELIADTARELFFERGFDAVTVAEIAREADVDTKTVYNYFPSKPELFYHRLEEFEQAMVDAVQARDVGMSILAAFGRFGLDAEALAGVAPRPGGRKHSVVAAQEVPRRRLGPGLEGPRLLQRLRSLVPFSPPCLGRKLRRDVVVEDILVPALLVADVRPPVSEELPGRRDHRRNEDEEVDGDANADERRRKAAERVAHDHDSATVADCPHDGAGRAVRGRATGPRARAAAPAPALPAPRRPPPPPPGSP